jgi:hypothetical protein
MDTLHLLPGEAGCLGRLYPDFRPPPLPTFFPETSALANEHTRRQETHILSV